MDAEILRMAKEFGKAMAEAQYKHFTEMTKTQKIINEGDDVKGRGGNADGLNPGERRDDSITKSIDKFDKSVDKFYKATKTGYTSPFDGGAKGIKSFLANALSGHSATAWATKAGRENMRSRMFAEPIEMRDNATGQERKIYDQAMKALNKNDGKDMVARTQSLRDQTKATNTLYHALLDVARGLKSAKEKLGVVGDTMKGSSLGDLISKNLTAREKSLYDEALKFGVQSKEHGDVLKKIAGFAEGSTMSSKELGALRNIIVNRSMGEGNAPDILNDVTTSFKLAVEKMFDADKLETFTAGLGGKGNIPEMTEAYKNINSGIEEMNKFVAEVEDLDLTSPMSTELNKLNASVATEGSNFNSIMYALFQDGAEDTVDRINTIMASIKPLDEEIYDLAEQGWTEQANEKGRERENLVLELKELSEKMGIMSTSFNNANTLLDPSLSRTPEQVELLKKLGENSHVISNSTDAGKALETLYKSSDGNFSDLIVALTQSAKQDETTLADSKLSANEKGALLEQSKNNREILGTWLSKLNDTLVLKDGTTSDSIKKMLEDVGNNIITADDLDANFDLSVIADSLKESAEEQGKTIGEIIVETIQTQIKDTTVSAQKDDHLRAKAKEGQNTQNRSTNNMIDSVELYGVKLGTIMESIGYSLSASRDEMYENIISGTKWGMGIALAGATQLWSDGAYAIRGQIEEQRRWQAATMGMSNKELLTGMMVYRDTLRKMASEQGINFEDLDIEQLQDMGKKYAISGEEAFHYGLRMKEATQLLALGSKANLEHMSDLYANSARLLNMTVDEFGEQFSEMANDPGLVAFMNIMKGTGPNMQATLAKELTTRIKVNKVLGQSNDHMKERMRLEAGNKFGGIEAFIKRQVGTSMEMDLLSDVTGIDFTEEDMRLGGMNRADMTSAEANTWETSGRVKYETAYADAARKHTEALENASATLMADGTVVTVEAARDAINQEYRGVMTILEAARGIHGQASVAETADAKYNTVVALLSGTTLEGKATEVINDMMDWTDIRGSVGDSIADKLETTLGFNETRIEASGTRQTALGVAENASGIVQSGIGKVLAGIVITLGNILAQNVLTNMILSKNTLKGAFGATLKAGKTALATAGKALQPYAKWAGRAGNVAITGMVLKDMYDVADDARNPDEDVKKEDTYALAGTAGGAALGGAIGAGIGALGFGVGAVPLGIAGAWIGAGIGNWLGENKGLEVDIKEATGVATGEVPRTDVSKDVKQILDVKLTGPDAREALSQQSGQETIGLTEAIKENTDTVKKGTQSYKEQTQKQSSRFDQTVSMIQNLNDNDFGPGAVDLIKDASQKSTFA